MPHRIVVWLVRLAGLVVFFGGWVFLTRGDRVSPLLLPPIASVWDALKTLVTTRDIWLIDLRTTLVEFLVAYALAIIVGLLVAFWGSANRLRMQAIDPLLQWGYIVPAVLMFPILTLWFGVGSGSKIAYGFIGGVFPIAINAVRGMFSESGKYHKPAMAYGASSWQELRYVRWGAALPMILAGFRIGASLTLIHIILGEMLSSEHGLGQRLAEASQTFQTPRMFGLIVLLIVFVLILNAFIRRLDTTRLTAGPRLRPSLLARRTITETETKE